MLFDISSPISENAAVWPGDVPLTRQWQSRFSEGANLDLSSVSTTVHIGAHADAPSHYHKKGVTIDQVSLEPYIGLCAVVDAGKTCISVEDCQKALRTKQTRILFKTLSQPRWDVFNEDFAYFDPKGLRLLGEAGVVLVGIDTPSVDPFSSKDLPAHQVLFEFGMRNLEGLDLSQVPDGIYELIALPLKLSGFDASPVRAILRSI